MITDTTVPGERRLSVVPVAAAAPRPRERCSGLRVRVLEVVSVTAGAGPGVTVGSLQQKTLLTLLVAAKGRSVSLDAIADELWPDERPRRWRGCIATLANSLRRTVGDAEFIFSTARGYTLHRCPEIVRTDVEELHDWLDKARQAEQDGLGDVAETTARAALVTYGNGPWTTDYWGWNEAAAEAARILAAALLRRRAYVACIAELSRAMEDFEWHDALWACLIYAHHQLGSAQRARELAQKAKIAVGIVTPLLAKVERQVSSPPSLDAPFYLCRLGIGPFFSPSLRCPLPIQLGSGHLPLTVALTGQHPAIGPAHEVVAIPTTVAAKTEVASTAFEAHRCVRRQCRAGLVIPEPFDGAQY